MNPTLLFVLAVAAAYLVGSVPFGYCVALWFKGVDVRKVGSGNIGATNVGRVLGFRYFCLVFTLDLLKGLMPTWGAPLAFERLTGTTAPPGLAVATALATILGHNFPIYLGFRGGKGVATSLGALIALDSGASLASALGFLVFLSVTRFVSLSSLLGGIVFVLVHFLRVERPWSRVELPMTLLTAALLVMLFARHRKNLARIWAGTEPKVSFRRRGPEPRAGKAAVVVVLSLAGAVAALALGALAWRVSNRPAVLRVGGTTFIESARVGTGHQRAERLAFAGGGTLLAVTCPRYQRLMIYRVGGPGGLELARDVELDGMPVAVCAGAERFHVLQRPPGDRRHVEPGWWEAFDLGGERQGDRVRVGFYPDDLVLSPDGRLAYLLTSGRSEGSEDRPAAGLAVFDLRDPSGPREVGGLAFDGAGDDPARLVLSASGRAGVVTMAGADVSVALDLSDPRAPLCVGRAPLGGAARPYLSRSGGDALVMPAASRAEAVRFSCGGVGEALACTLPRGGGLEVVAAGRRGSLGRLPLRGGGLGLASVRPTGLAYAPETRTLAVADRAGGVHLVKLVDDAGSPRTAPVLALPGGVRGR